MSVETSEVQGVASESALEDGKRAEASETRTFAKTKHEKHEGRVRIAKSAAAWVMAIFYLFPVYWMVCTAFKTQKETFVQPPHIIPQIRRLIPSESPSVTTSGSGRHWGTRRSSLLGVWY